jgi:hypothetical protein
LDASKKIEAYHRKHQQKKQQKKGIIVLFPSLQAQNEQAL